MIDATYLKAHRTASGLEVQKGIKPSIPGRKSRSLPIKCDKRRNHIAIMFDRLEDWRRVATRYDRCQPCSPLPSLWQPP